MLKGLSPFCSAFTSVTLLTLFISLPTRVFGGDGDSFQLPPDPKEWVCKDPMAPTEAEEKAWCESHRDRGQPAALGRPPGIFELKAQNEFNQKLQNFLVNRDYAEKLNWIGDAEWRLTGPYVGSPGEGSSYGTHPIVRIFYSPKVMDWLCHGRVGEIPDGAMIIKEMYDIDEDAGLVLNDEGCMVVTNTKLSPESWTVMIKSKESSFDGWYWVYVPLDNTGNPPLFTPVAVTDPKSYLNPQVPDPHWLPTGALSSDTTKSPNVLYPNMGYGNYCINCHASAVSESTFSDLRNPMGKGIGYKGYDFDTDSAEPAGGLESQNPHNQAGLADLLATQNSGDPWRFNRALPLPDKDFLAFYNQIPPVTFPAAYEHKMPAVTFDSVVSGSEGADQFITSDQCKSCHDVVLLTSLPANMRFFDEKEDVYFNLSPFGEWRASPMGLAGRDPIFFAQLQSETNHLPELTECIEDLCLQCHGVMGKRQLAIDTEKEGTDKCLDLFAYPPPEGVPNGKLFSRSMVKPWQKDQGSDPTYAALARDGISCRVCHNISEKDLNTEAANTGNFVSGPADVVYGPFADDTIKPKPMQHALDITPHFAEQLTDAAMCGSCHDILLPVFKNDGKRAEIGSSYEQSTHLEWTNSVFGQKGSPEYRTCQDCHMPETFKGKKLAYKIANIEDSTYPPTDNILSTADLDLEVRDTYKRHSLHGLNVFLNEMFQQFPVLLGFRQIGWLNGATSTTPPLLTGRESMLEMARSETATIEITHFEISGTKLKAEVLIRNKTGHYFPSGVGFRRAFIEFLVQDQNNNNLWASGRTNDLGVILDGLTDQPLKSELVLEYPKGPIQPHYLKITEPNQVQIYQEVNLDSAGDQTSSFLRRYEEIKDNRIRPKGYNPKFFTDNPSQYIQPLGKLLGNTQRDPHYYDPNLTGSDTIEYLIELDPALAKRVHHIKVALHNQSIPPSYLQQRFRDANVGPKKKDDIQQLYYLTSHLNTKARDAEGKTFMNDWKLTVASTKKGL